MAKFQANKTHCKRGHEFNEENTYFEKRGRACRACKREHNRAAMKAGRGKYEFKTEYNTWRKMIERCRRVTDPAYPDYGGRGIAICDRWKSFDNFLKDMGLRPSPGHSLDRIDTNGNYEPSNCRWATREEQNNNKRNNIRVIFSAEEKTLAQWSRETGIRYATLYQRINRSGWSVEKALTLPTGTTETVEGETDEENDKAA